MNTFTCVKCKRQSRYLHRVGGRRWEFAMGILNREDETRTYECERCHTENQVTHSQVDWMTIDLGAAST